MDNRVCTSTRTSGTKVYSRFEGCGGSLTSRAQSMRVSLSTLTASLVVCFRTLAISGASVVRGVVVFFIVWPAHFRPPRIFISPALMRQNSRKPRGPHYDGPSRSTFRWTWRFLQSYSADSVGDTDILARYLTAFGVPHWRITQ